MDSWNNSKETSFQEDEDWTQDTQECMLFFGLPKHGKTFAYCSFIEKVLNDGGTARIISTEGGFPRTGKAYFGERVTEIKDKIKVTRVFDINGKRSYYKKIRNEVKKNDVLIIDLLSDAWEWAQINFVEKMVFDGDIEDYIGKAMKDPAMFGMFEKTMWHYIKALHKFVEDIIVRRPCHFIGVCAEKDKDTEERIGGEKARKLNIELGYNEMTTKATGNKLLPSKFETVIRVGREGKRHFFQVVGDRGHEGNTSKNFYERNMYKKLIEWRNKKEV